MSAQAGRKRLQTQCLNVWSSLLRLVSEEAGDPGSGAGRLSRLRPCRIAAVCAVLLLFGLVSGLGRGSDSPAPGRQAARHRKALHDVQTEAIEDPNPQTLHEQQQLQQQQVEQHQKQAPTLPGSNDQAVRVRSLQTPRVLVARAGSRVCSTLCSGIRRPAHAAPPARGVCRKRDRALLVKQSAAACRA